MKRAIFTFILFFIVGFSFSQTNKIINRDSVLIKIDSLLSKMECRDKYSGGYKLYPTENMYIFLKLNSLTGRLELVQWSFDAMKEFSMFINSKDLSYTIVGTNFELYPTENMFKFLMLEKVTGRVWHVQWGFKAEDCWIRQIF